MQGVPALIKGTEITQTYLSDDYSEYSIFISQFSVIVDIYYGCCYVLLI